jgi:hypothetical protein
MVYIVINFSVSKKYRQETMDVKSKVSKFLFKIEDMLETYNGKTH